MRTGEGIFPGSAEADSRSDEAADLLLTDSKIEESA